MPFNAVMDDVDLGWIGSIKFEDLIFDIVGINDDAFDMRIFEGGFLSLRASWSEEDSI